jgi:hypothetical protein
MREIAPGLWHCTARHPRIGLDVSSYYLSDERVLIDPLVPPEGLAWFDEHRALACADGVVRLARSTRLSFVPDGLMDDPERTKAGLRRAYRALLELDFDVLLLAHGDPVVGDAKRELEEFVQRA